MPAPGNPAQPYPDIAKLRDAAAELNIEADVLRQRVNDLGHAREVWAAYECIVTAANALASAASWLNRYEENMGRNELHT